MRNSARIAILAAGVLAGCAHGDRHHGNPPPGRGEAALVKVDVTVSGDTLSVYPPIFSVPEGARSVVVEWRLKGDSGAKFAPEGIVFEGEVQFPTDTVVEGGDRRSSNAMVDSNSSEVRLRFSRERISNFNCPKIDGGQTFFCASDAPVMGLYKYTVRVVSPSGKVLKLDPGGNVLK